MSERVLLPKVLSIARRILRDEDQFLHAFFRQLVRFSNDRSKAAAAKMAAHLRDETEGTRTIASLGNLYEGRVTRRREHAWSRFIVQIGCALIPEGNYGQRSRIRFWIAYV